METPRKLNKLAALACAGMFLTSWLARAREPADDLCPRPGRSSVVTEPPDLRSRNGVLKVDLTFHSSSEPDGA